MKKELKDLNCNIETGICGENHTSDLKTETTVNTQQTTTITYYYDALCGWCYGFKNEFEKFKKAHEHQIEFKLINGGLFQGNRVGLINNVAPYIKQGAYKAVEQTTGVKFGDIFLDKLFGDGNIFLNSIPPSIAVCIIKDQLPEKTFDFSELLLSAVYHDGLNPDDIEAYKPYVVQIGYNFELFKTQMNDAKYLKLVEKDFQNFADNKISGMPTLVVSNGRQKAYLSNGFATFEDLESRLEAFKNQDL